ncbi:transcriptional regulator, partial [Clavibacter michiganensis subsp. michiganensis]|nr:transcriptional regulator [Clavibacter michiganensis subsp. michiganensis]
VVLYRAALAMPGHERDGSGRDAR